VPVRGRGRYLPILPADLWASKMGKSKRARAESDDDYSDDDMPDMSRGAQRRMDPPSAAAQPSGSALAPPPPPPPPAAPPSPEWHTLLDKLLSRFFTTRSKFFECPFTRRGLSELCRLDRDTYEEFRTASGFDLPADPTIAQSTGGGAFCSTAGLTKHSVEQHCGCQPGGKTSVIARAAPRKDDVNAWEKFSTHEQLHFALLLHLRGVDELPAAQRREALQAQTFESHKAAWPPMLRLDGIRARTGERVRSPPRHVGRHRPRTIPIGRSGVSPALAPAPRRCPTRLRCSSSASATATSAT
jgi:hypothetical protein